ncbi:hypothetical protein OAD66_03580 [Bacteroidia bacterium]|nr:hypothetical protein [Bacteroidia bacterium]
MNLLNKSKIILLFIILAVGCSEDGTSPSRDSSSGGTSENSGSGSGTGQGGSVARFTIAKEHLYVATENSIFTYSLANPAEPKFVSNQQQWTIVETIYSMNDYLFLGTQTGVIIYSIENPSTPVYMSAYQHIRSCDPVVAKGKYAYSTLQTNNRCSRGVNLLDVINIENIHQPLEAHSRPMEKPSGLGISGDYLFVCDNGSLRTFNLANPALPVYQATRPVDGCFDVIAKDGHIIVVSAEGITQFSVDSQGSLTQLSSIPKE